MPPLVRVLQPESRPLEATPLELPWVPGWEWLLGAQAGDGNGRAKKL